MCLAFYDHGETDVFTISRKMFGLHDTGLRLTDLLTIDLSSLKYTWIHYTLKRCPYILIYVHIRGSVNINW